MLLQKNGGQVVGSHYSLPVRRITGRAICRDFMAKRPAGIFVIMLAAILSALLYSDFGFNRI